jgi:hypothetical protein
MATYILLVTVALRKASISLEKFVPIRKKEKRGKPFSLGREEPCEKRLPGRARTPDAVPFSDERSPSSSCAEIELLRLLKGLCERQ